jgi:hypothetical protein
MNTTSISICYFFLQYSHVLGENSCRSLCCILFPLTLIAYWLFRTTAAGLKQFAHFCHFLIFHHYVNNLEAWSRILMSDPFIFRHMHTQRHIHTYIHTLQLFWCEFLIWFFIQAQIVWRASKPTHATPRHTHIYRLERTYIHTRLYLYEILNT